MTAGAPSVLGLETAVYVMPADAPEADGTLAWDKTTMLLVAARAGGEQGIGWSYPAAAVQSVVTDVLAGVVAGRSALDVAGAAEAGLAVIRGQILPDVTAGEYSWPLADSARLIDAGAVDCLQLDVTQCGGISEFLRGAALAAASNLQVSAHCTPNLHAHVAAAVPNLSHVEYFHDHQRIEQMFFDGVLDPGGGVLTPDPAVPGLGMELRAADAERYRRG
jgi:Enolase C-terminal domain-like